jgi:hypothetical protein
LRSSAFLLSALCRPSTVNTFDIPQRTRKRSWGTMCRALVYLGKPTLVDRFLYQPDSCLVRQSYDPQQLHMLNFGGFVMHLAMSLGLGGA